MSDKRYPSSVCIYPYIFDFISELETVSTTETMTKLRKPNIFKTTNLSSMNDSCYCFCSNINNVSFKEDDLLKKIEQIRSDLVVDTKSTNKYKRSLISMADDRGSSKCIGCFAIFVLLIVFSIFVLLDLQHFGSYILKKN